jgi:hypothetical protein
MRYRVYGLDAISKEPREPVIIEAASEEAARQQATEMGIAVESVEQPDAPMPSPPPPRTRRADPRLTPLGQQVAEWLEQVTPWWVWLCLTVGQVVSVLGCVAFAVNTVIALVATSRVKLLGLVEAGEMHWLLLLVVGAAGVCWNGALYIVFSRAKRQGRA